MNKKNSLYSLLFLCSAGLQSQNLTFSPPLLYLPDARTDKAVDFVNFKAGYFVGWKGNAQKGKIHFCYLGKHDKNSFYQKEDSMNETSPYPPVFYVTRQNLYLFWIAADGSIHYIMNATDSSLNTGSMHILNLKGPLRPLYGISTTVIAGKLMIATHAVNKKQLLYAVIDNGPDGIFPDAELKVIDGINAANYPFLVNLSDTVARICYQGYKDQHVCYRDYNYNTETWSDQTVLPGADSKISPAIYHVLDASRLFYIWRGTGKDKKIYYATGRSNGDSISTNALPDYFATDYPVAICNVDANNFIMAYTGLDKRFYLSYFSNYDPASWMQDLLISKADYTLKDILIPGSHDAGMSVLSGTGGSVAGSINSCNTLTQSQSIGKQLNTGIRMFDLRVGIYNGRVYSKHFASDCPEEAIGGGYGELLKEILTDVRQFLQQHNKELVLLTFSHFCEKEIPIRSLADTVRALLGEELLYHNPSKGIHEATLSEMAGKVLVSFENYINPGEKIDSCSSSDSSRAFINFKREYAGTDDIMKLSASQEAFFKTISKGVRDNDLVRLDWQLTQSSDEAAMVCNDFQSEKTGVLLNSALLLTNVIMKHQSIIDLSINGNKYLPGRMNEWVSSGIINKKNKPNILYVDVAGSWITDYCIDLNGTQLYTK